MEERQPHEITTAEPFVSYLEIYEDTKTRIVKDMTEHGFDPAHPIVMGKGPWCEHEDGVVIDGHTRLEAALEVDLENIPVRVVEFRTEDEAFSYMEGAQHNRRDNREWTLMQQVRARDLRDRAARHGNQDTDDTAQSLRSTNGKKAASIGAALGINTRKVEQIRRLWKDDGETAGFRKQIREGPMSVNAAYNALTESGKGDSTRNVYKLKKVIASGDEKLIEEYANKRLSLNSAEQLVDKTREVRDVVLAEEPRKRAATIKRIKQERSQKQDEHQSKEADHKRRFNSCKGEGISWADWSWNPQTGCQNTCPYCYARELAPIRYKDRIPNPENSFKPRFWEERLSAAYSKSGLDKGNRVFVGSMGDTWGDWVNKEDIKKILEACKKNPQWTFYFLTKNPARYLEFKQQIPANCLLGATADGQKGWEVAVKAFEQIDTHRKFLSCEPLRTEIDPGDDLGHIDWLIIGAETRGQKTVFNPPWQWVGRLLGAAAKADIPVHCKPNLTVRPYDDPPNVIKDAEIEGGGRS